MEIEIATLNTSIQAKQQNLAGANEQVAVLTQEKTEATTNLKDEKAHFRRTGVKCSELKLGPNLEWDALNALISTLRGSNFVYNRLRDKLSQLNDHN
jgi:hypothetical protein